MDLTNTPKVLSLAALTLGSLCSSPPKMAHTLLQVALSTVALSTAALTLAASSHVLYFLKQLSFLPFLWLVLIPNVMASPINMAKVPRPNKCIKSSIIK